MNDLPQKIAAALAAAQLPDAPLHMAVQTLAPASPVEVLRRAPAQPGRRMEES